MSISGSKIAPTMTLAQLYEAQQQYFDAFMIYKKLAENNSGEEIQSRMERTKSKIFTDSNVVYQEIISRIFTSAERELFKIIPQKNFEAFHEIEKEPEETVFSEDEFEENEYDMSDAEELEQIYNPSDLPDFDQYQAEMDNFKEHVSDNFDLNDLPVNNGTLMLSDLSSLLIKETGRDKALSDLTLIEIFQIMDIIKKQLR